MKSPSQFIYPISTGRSGTVFLSKLLELNLSDAQVYHERVGYPHFGRTSPDAPHFVTFNHVGNTAEVAAFWNKKFQLDAQTNKNVFAEVSHFLAKAGLMENLRFLPTTSQIDIVVLKRDVFKVLWSYVNRFDFANYGFTWLFTLDPRYRNVILNSKPYLDFGAMGLALWYIHEMYARMAYYRRWCQAAKLPNLRFHEVTLEEIVKPQGAVKLLNQLDCQVTEETLDMPSRQNETKTYFFGEKEEAQARLMMERVSCDPDALAGQFWDQGFRLGRPHHLRS